MKQLYATIADIFNVPASEITADSSMDTISSWDSLNHMMLVVALEERYGISFAPEDIIEMVSVKIIREVLKEKGVQFSHEDV